MASMEYETFEMQAYAAGRIYEALERIAERLDISERTITLHTTVYVNNDPPPIPNITDDGEVIWLDRDGNPLEEPPTNVYYRVQTTMPIRIRARDIIAVLPEFDDMSEYWGDTPHRSELLLRDQSPRLTVRESVNEVLALLGWGEMDVTGPHPRYWGR